VLGGEGTEPGVEVGGGGAGEEDVEPRGVAMVGGEDPGDRGGEGGGGDGEVGVEEVERGRGPEAAPAAGEDLGARGGREGEEREDGSEDAIGEEADQIGVGGGGDWVRWGRGQGH